MRLRTAIRSAVRNVTGYDVHKFDPRFSPHAIRAIDVGRTPYQDIAKRLAEPCPVLFDVGANIGQTTEQLIKSFPTAQIHAFEPGADAFCALSAAYQARKEVHLNNVGVAANSGNKPFFENSITLLSSFLRIGVEGWGIPSKRIAVPVITIDEYCSMRNISHIDLLKSDTQGFDLEVLKGSTRMLNARRISLIYLEIILVHLYSGLPRMEEIMSFLAEYQISLIGIYNLVYSGDRLGWFDALFATNSCVD
jgi:FkbM family methyltransferase